MGGGGDTHGSWVLGRQGPDGTVQRDVRVTEDKTYKPGVTVGWERTLRMGLGWIVSSSLGGQSRKSLREVGAGPFPEPNTGTLFCFSTCPTCFEGT